MMRRAARLGMLIGLVVGLTACAGSGTRAGPGGVYGGIEVGRTATPSP